MGAASRENSKGLMERKRTFIYPDLILPDEYPGILGSRERTVFFFYALERSRKVLLMNPK